MVFKPLPRGYRKTPAVTTTVDFFDTITGIGYKKFFLAGAVGPSGELDFFLTTDATITSDEENNKVNGNSADIDFDIKVGKGFTIDAEDVILVMSRNADTSSTQTLTYTIRHVDSGATETSIGTAVSDPISGGGGTEFFLKTQRIALTRQRFKPGEILRFNVTSSSGAFDHFDFDPSGLHTQTTEVPNYPHTSFILIPIEVRL